MPFIYKGRMLRLDMAETILTDMTTRQLIEYESYLWMWMNKSPPTVVAVLNAIYREMEWRAQDREFG